MEYPNNIVPGVTQALNIPTTPWNRNMLGHAWHPAGTLCQQEAWIFKTRPSESSWFNIAFLKWSIFKTIGFKNGRMTCMIWGVPPNWGNAHPYLCIKHCYSLFTMKNFMKNINHYEYQYTKQWLNICFFIKQHARFALRTESPQLSSTAGCVQSLVLSMQLSLGRTRPSLRCEEHFLMNFKRKVYSLYDWHQWCPQFFFKQPPG